MEEGAKEAECHWYFICKCLLNVNIGLYFHHPRVSVTNCPSISRLKQQRVLGHMSMQKYCRTNCLVWERICMFKLFNKELLKKKAIGSDAKLWENGSTSLTQTQMQVKLHLTCYWFIPTHI